MRRPLPRGGPSRRWCPPSRCWCRCASGRSTRPSARGDHECVHRADDGCTIQFVSAARGRGGGTAEQAPVQRLTLDATLHGPSQASPARSARRAVRGRAQRVRRHRLRVRPDGLGKMYTMSGADPDCGSPPTTASYRGGRQPRGADLARARRARADRAGGRARADGVRVDLELYNEQINDLLNPASTNLNLRWNASAGAFVQDLLQVECENVGDAQLVFEEGTRNRKVGSHSMNKDSSRSHCIMTLHIGSAQTGRMGKLSFVDLAGSERLVETRHNTSGSGIKEAGHINKSSSRCVTISALRTRRRGGHPVLRLEADAASSTGWRRRPHDDARVIRRRLPPRGDDQHAALRVAREEHHQPPVPGRHPRRALADAAVAPPAPRGEPDAQDALVVAPSSAATPATAAGGRPAAPAAAARLLGRDDVD